MKRLDQRVRGPEGLLCSPPTGPLNAGDMQFGKLQATLEGPIIPPHGQKETTAYV